MRDWGRVLLVLFLLGVGFRAERLLAQGAESVAPGPPLQRFTLELRDADVKDVLRLIGQESGLNIIVGEEITGKVTVSFKEVTLDQALASILQSFGYAHVVNDGIVVVTKSAPAPVSEQIVITVKEGAAVGQTPAQKLFSLDFRDAEAKDVLRLLGQKSGLNIIVGDEIAGKITVSLKDVTLDQALLSVLQGFGCSYSTTDGIVLVTRNPNPERFVSRAIKILYLVDTSSVDAKDHREQELEALAASLRPLLSSPPQGQIRREVVAASGTARETAAGVAGSAAEGVGDATASGPAATVERASGEGASIRVFPRINTLLVTDVPERVERIVALITELDTPTPQIKIEARIVEVKDIYQKELGIQWGARFTADAAHGNALPHEFPNSVAFGSPGSVFPGEGGAPEQGTAPAGNYLVNLPAASPVAGVGISLGHIANVLSLDLKLSAMEKMDKIKILSTPSIITMQGKEAVIKVGEQLPYTTNTTANNITQSAISFKDIGLQLRVVPSVLPEGRIILDLVINKDTRGEKVVIQGEQNYSIDTKSLTTRVLLRDGETGVLGGLYTQQENGSTSQVPLLGRIPLLGWLFRSRSEGNVRNELLVFLTPRIQPP